MPSPFAPPPTAVGGRTVVAPDVTAVEAGLRFDAAAREATARAAVRFTMDNGPGRPAIDLRQEVDEVRLDGRALPADAWAPTDLGGGEDAAIRVLDVELEGGGEHLLEVTYRLGTPAAGGAEPVGWVDGGVRFDLWMSDLLPGRYLEMWVPAPLCHDRFALTVDVEVLEAGREHVLLANDGGLPAPGRRWRSTYPAAFTALSPMLVVAPEDDVERRRLPVSLPGWPDPVELITARHMEVDADLAAVEADVAAWMSFNHVRFGPWAHGPTMTAFVWGPGRGMEYDGATTASVPAMEHEVFHSWFGRGLKPARASDGWIDEAYTTWSTSSRRVEGPRFGTEPLGLDEEPVLLCPPHPWSRYTPRESYGAGSRLFAGVADLLGGADRLRSAMAGFYTANRGGLITTEGLLAHLQAGAGVDLTPWWDRYVYGRG
jgi:hypothetical protein